MVGSAIFPHLVGNELMTNNFKNGVKLPRTYKCLPYMHLHVHSKFVPNFKLFQAKATVANSIGWQANGLLACTATF